MRAAKGEAKEEAKEEAHTSCRSSAPSPKTAPSARAMPEAEGRRAWAMLLLMLAPLSATRPR